MRFGEFFTLSADAKVERARDLRGEVTGDRGMRRAIHTAISWLCRAQDCTASKDGGVSHSYSLAKRCWLPSYPETTGYIVPSFLRCADFLQDSTLRVRAKAMLDWLLSIQLPDGGFQGSTVFAKPVVPVAFNTGQILLGLASGVRCFGSMYQPAMVRAADWLVQVQDRDGSWRRFQSPFIDHGDRAYDVHIAWGLLEAARLEPTRGYAEAALKNIRWALQHQRNNGWFAQCCIDDPFHPLTHTLGYALRGLIEAYRFTGDRGLLERASMTADGLLHALAPDGFLPGRLDRDWRGAATWSCLTGTAQIASCWLLLHDATKRSKYRDSAYRANAFLRRTLHYAGHLDIVGGIKGSFPVSGSYLPYSYPNWACKFFVDANLLEYSVRRTQESVNVAALAS
jgi:Squalene-hopene cyclase C-terminal domain